MSSPYHHDPAEPWLQDGKAPVDVSSPQEQIRVLLGRENQIKRILRFYRNRMESDMLKIDDLNRELDEVSTARLEIEDAEYAVEDEAKAK